MGGNLDYNMKVMKDQFLHQVSVLFLFDKFLSVTRKK